MIFKVSPYTWAMENISTDTLSVVTVTPQALSIVRGAIDQEGGPDTMALWLEVRGAAKGAYTYDLYIQAISDASGRDVVESHDGVSIVIPAQSVEQLRGARLEFSEEGEGGLVMVNPNTPKAVGGAPIPPEVFQKGLETDMARTVRAVLDEQVNPSIAGHGGSAHLVALDDEKGIAYVSLAGGCQGCAMSRLTLSQGIEVAIKDAVPAITEVVDVTDHELGDSPYYS